MASLFLNTFQKLLTNSGEKPTVINFYTYLGLTFLCLPFVHKIDFSSELLLAVLIMGLLGALGNGAIIKALSYGELSSLAPINSYKPVVALIFGIFLLNELPCKEAIFGIFLIIFGTFILFKGGDTDKRAVFYRVIALFLSGTEAIFIKKVILLSDITIALFFWALFGMLFSLALALHNPVKIRLNSIKYQIALIAMVGIMQFSTNYVFLKMNVAYALALFQLSTILSVFLGVNIFKESGLVKKLLASTLMIAGAVIILLN